MKITLFLKDTNSTDIISIQLLYHFSMFNNIINIRLNSENLLLLVKRLIEEKIKFEFDGIDSIKINTSLINFRIDN